MEEVDKRKSIRDLVRTFDNQKNDSNIQNKKTNTNTKKEKVPLFPTLKKLPDNVNNEYTEKKQGNNPGNDEFIKKSQTNISKATPSNEAEKEKAENNPFAFFWEKAKQNKIKDDSNVISGKMDNNTFEEPRRRRNSSFNKKKETKKVEMFADNQEQGGDIPDADDPVVPLTYKETEELLKDPKFANVKELKQLTESEVSKTVIDKNKGHSNIVNSLVSQDKSRFCYDGFDLDLTYITPRIIAMGFPSSSIEGIYRNSMEDVKKFFTKRHPNHYKVYNLCDDKKYSSSCFYKQGYFPFRDHEAPPLNLIRPFCEDAKQFLDEDKDNVVSIHCKAGKGRTGTFICCLLLYMKFFDTADECLLYYGLMRVGTPKGVTVPSQIRYVHYFESILKNNIPHPITFKKILIRKVKMYTIPKFGKKKKLTPLFSIENQGKVVKYSDLNKKKRKLYSNKL